MAEPLGFFDVSVEDVLCVDEVGGLFRVIVENVVSDTELVFECGDG